MQHCLDARYEERKKGIFSRPQPTKLRGDLICFNKFTSHATVIKFYFLQQPAKFLCCKFSSASKYPSIEHLTLPEKITSTCKTIKLLRRTFNRENEMKRISFIFDFCGSCFSNCCCFFLSTTE